MTRLCLDHVGVNVKDLDESAAFYQAIWGLELIQRWDHPRQAFVGRDGLVLGLLEHPGYDFSRSTLAQVAVACTPEEFPSMVRRIRQLDAPIVSGPKPQRDGQTILFRDPSGNILEICSTATVMAGDSGGRKATYGDDQVTTGAERVSARM
jgi:catechol 2,3-dioxygenase-like lactoylglutathione lyase family enzyme